MIAVADTPSAQQAQVTPLLGTNLLSRSAHLRAQLPKAA
jgi:hypothetical protein